MLPNLDTTRQCDSDKHNGIASTCSLPPICTGLRQHGHGCYGLPQAQAHPVHPQQVHLQEEEGV